MSVHNGRVSLQFYRSEDKGALEGYTLRDEQERFTAFPDDALKKCEKDLSRYPVLIFYEDKPVGFFVLHGWEGVKEYSENQDAILLRAYSVHAAFQGRGIAKESLNRLPAFVKSHFSDKTEIILAVNQTNLIAQKLYKNAGFMDQGIRKMGPKGELIILHKKIGTQD